MEPDKFWTLSYYEWTLWLMRIKAISDKRRHDHELLIELERNSMAVMVNLWSKKKVTGKDFYSLRADREEQTPVQMTGAELMESLKERFNKPIKKRG